MPDTRLLHALSRRDPRPRSKEFYRPISLSECIVVYRAEGAPSSHSSDTSSTILRISLIRDRWDALVRPDLVGVVLARFGSTPRFVNELTKTWRARSTSASVIVSERRTRALASQCRWSAWRFRRVTGIGPDSWSALASRSVTNGCSQTKSVSPKQPQTKSVRSHTSMSRAVAPSPTRLSSVRSCVSPCSATAIASASVYDRGGSRISSVCCISSVERGGLAPCTEHATCASSNSSQRRPQVLPRRKQHPA